MFEAILVMIAAAVSGGVVGAAVVAITMAHRRKCEDEVCRRISTKTRYAALRARDKEYQ